MSKTEHQSTVGGPHPDVWRDGATCEECNDAHIIMVVSKHNRPPMTNLAWLKASNENSQTAMEMVKEIEAGAKESGSDIRHVGGNSKEKSDRNARIYGRDKEE